MIRSATELSGLSSFIEAVLKNFAVICLCEFRVTQGSVTVGPRAFGTPTLFCLFDTTSIGFRVLETLAGRALMLL